MQSNILYLLEKEGCNIDDAIERFGEDTDLYLSCVQMALDDDNFFKLGEMLEKQDVKQAFFHAHTLKGMLANVCLDPLFDLTVLIVEPLRNGDMTGLMPLYEQLMEKRKAFTELF